MKKLIPIIIVAVVIAVAAWFMLGGGGSTPSVGQALVAKETTAVAGSQQLDTMVQRWLPLASLSAGAEGAPDMSKAEVRVKELGFDPATADGWQSIGIDPAAGVNITFDARVLNGGAVAPIALLKLTDEEKLLEFIGKRSGQPAKIGGDGPVRVLEGGPQKMLIGTRQGYTAVLLDGSADDAKLKQGFEAFISGEGDSLASAPAFKDAFAEARNPLFYAWGGADQAGKVAAALGAPEEIASSVDFFAKLFPAVGFHISDSGAKARLVASEQGVTLLRKLFVPQRGAPKFSKYIPAKGWAALRMSYNLKDLLSGVSDALPPAAAQARAGIGFLPMMLTAAAGVTWDEIGAALSGHVVTAVELANIKNLDNPTQAEGLAMLAVNEEAAADKLLESLYGQLTTKVPGVQVTEVEVGGAKGRKIAMGPIAVVVVRDDDVVLIGKEDTVKKAMDNSDSLGGFGAEAIDGEVVFAAYADLSKVLPELRTSEEALDKLLKDPNLAPVAEDPRFMVKLGFDKKGLLAEGEGPIPGDLLLTAAGMSWFLVGNSVTTSPVEAIEVPAAPAAPVVPTNP